MFCIKVYTFSSRVCVVGQFYLLQLFKSVLDSDSSSYPISTSGFELSLNNSPLSLINQLINKYASSEDVPTWKINGGIHSMCSATTTA